MPEARLERTRKAYADDTTSHWLFEQLDKRERDEMRERDKLKPLLEQRWRLVEDRATT